MKQNEGDAVIINSNFMIDANFLPVKDSIALEDQSSPYELNCSKTEKDSAKLKH